MSKSLKDFMPKQVRESLGRLPTTHHNCIMASGGYDAGGVARPGKTARDRAKAKKAES